LAFVQLAGITLEFRMANRHQLVGSLFLVEIFKKFPVIGLGDPFASECIRHHPVFRNPKQKGRLCGHFLRVVVSNLWSHVSRACFGAFVSGGENPVPNSNRAG
jgi:hypothetical protein